MTRNTKGPSRPESDNVVPLRLIADPTPEAFVAILEQVALELAELRREVAALRCGPRSSPALAPVEVKRGPTSSAEGQLLYGIPAIARYLGIRPRQAKHRLAMGHIPSFRMGDSVCARRSDLDAWLAELATGGQG